MYLFMSMLCILKLFSNLPFSSLASQCLSLVQLHIHERFHLNNDELVGTIWERKESGVLLNLEPCHLDKGITLTIQLINVVNSILYKYVIINGIYYFMGF